METPDKDARPGHCVFGCRQPVGSPHQWCERVGVVQPEEARQLGGVEPVKVSLDARLPLFVYRLLREGSPGAIERLTVEVEGPSGETTVSNPYLWDYALNVAGRLTPAEGGDLVIVQMPASSPRDDLSDVELDPSASLVVAVWPGGDFRVLQRRTSQRVRIQGSHSEVELLNKARSAIEGLLRAGSVSETDQQTDIAAAKDWLAAYEAHAG